MAKIDETSSRVEMIKENIKKLSHFLEGKEESPVKTGVDLAGLVKKLRDRKKKKGA